MVTAEHIKGYISAAIDCELVEVQGDGQHWEAVIVSREFEGKNTVQQHQLVYRALGDRMKEEIHALSMRTMSPAQWNKL
jgi:acid stress-induced BolA-like protein IbaG/YrbA